MADYFGFYGPSFVGPGGLEGATLNDVERTFYEWLDLYEPYWSGEPAFDCANTRSALPHLPCPEVDEAMLRRLIDYAVRDQWGKRARGGAGPPV